MRRDDKVKDEGIKEAADDDVLEEGAEWTDAATTEEVIEALRRVLLSIGAEPGGEVVDEFIKLLHQPNFCIDSFRRAFPAEGNLS